jgi:hypothetical protein
LAVFTQPLDTTWRYGFEYASTLGEATIEDSSWSADPAVGITLSADANDDDSTSVLAEVTTAGTYRLINVIEASDGTTDEQSHILVVEEAPDNSYLGPEQAQIRLAAYGIDARPSMGDLVAASYELDGQGPFIGERLDSSQTLAFPRTLNPDYTANTDEDVPGRILDWVALKSYQLTNEEEPGVVSESIGLASVSYSTPKTSQTSRRLEFLISPYLARGAQTSVVGSSFDTEIYQENYPYRWGLPLP